MKPFLSLTPEHKHRAISADCRGLKSGLLSKRPTVIVMKAIKIKNKYRRRFWKMEKHNRAPKNIKRQSSYRPGRPQSSRGNG
jgi:hypothetical protein